MTSPTASTSSARPSGNSTPTRPGGSTRPSGVRAPRRPGTRTAAGPVRLAAWGLAVAVLAVPVLAGAALVLAGAGAAVGAATGAGVAALVVVSTLGQAVLGRRLAAEAFAGLLAFGFLAKVLVVVGLVALLGPEAGVARTAFGLALVAGLLGALVVEAVVSLRARTPYVEPRPAGR